MTKFFSTMVTNSKFLLIKKLEFHFPDYRKVSKMTRFPLGKAHPPPLFVPKSGGGGGGGSQKVVKTDERYHEISKLEKFWKRFGTKLKNLEKIWKNCETIDFLWKLFFLISGKRSELEQKFRRIWARKGKNNPLRTFSARKM